MTAGLAAVAATPAQAQGITINSQCVYGPVFVVYPTDKVLGTDASLSCFNFFGNTQSWTSRMSLYPVDGTRLPVYGGDNLFAPGPTSPFTVRGPRATNVDFGSLQRPAHWEACFRASAVDGSVSWQRCQEVLLARTSYTNVTRTLGDTEELTFPGGK